MRRWDVIVAGGGPAGSACARHLAGAGHSVLVLEAAQFPRFAVGESLLPSTIAILDELGINLERDGHLIKRGAVFRDESQGRSARYDFSDVLPGGPTHAYQVERSVFDHRLLGAAQEAGAIVRQQARVEHVELGPDAAVVSVGNDREIGRFFVDATGRGRLLAAMHRSTRPLRGMGRAAMFAHARGVSDEVWSEVSQRGDVEILRLPTGWGWAIPLAGRRVSMGVVVQRGKLERDALHQAISSSPRLQRLAAGAALSETRTAGDWSYDNAQRYGARWACVGDAAYFLDPVFSSGISFALQSGLWTARSVAAALDGRQEARPDLLSDVEARLRRGYRTFHRLIHRFYETSLFDTLLLAGDPDPIMRRGLTTLLAGDVWRDDNPFEDRLMRSRLAAPGEASL